MDLERIAAFSDGNRGGNPAGVAFVDRMPADADMLAVAADVGYSETAFLAPAGNAWRVRYFAPETEVPFCGHATIASGAALGRRHGAGRYRFVLNDADIAVEALALDDDAWGARLESPPTWSRAPADDVAAAFLATFAIEPSDQHPELPVRLAHAGATHLVIPLAQRARLARMAYPFEPVKSLMQANDIVTVSLVWPESSTRYHARNAFAVGGVVEDPATGAAAAALAGYLRDTGRLGSGSIDILQGDDMGQPSRIRADFDATPGTAVRVSGRTRRIGGG